MKITRTLALVGAAICVAATSQGALAADLVIVNAKVFTSVGRPHAQAVIITGGRITFVGSTAAVQQRADGTVRTVDAGGGSSHLA